MRRRLARAATASAEAAEASASAGVAAAIDMPFLSAQRLRAASAIRARASGLRRRRPPRRPRTARAGGAGAGVGSVGATAAPVSRRCNSFSRDSICSLIATARRSCSLDKLASAAFMNSVNTVLVRSGKQESERKAPWPMPLYLKGIPEPKLRHAGQPSWPNQNGSLRRPAILVLPPVECHRHQPKHSGHGANLT